MKGLKSLTVTPTWSVIHQNRSIMRRTEQSIALVDEVNVCRVSIQGLKRTKNDIIQEHVKELLGVKPLKEMLECSLKCLQKLRFMDCFKDIEIKYDVARNKEGAVKGVEVIYMVKESGRLRSSLSANAGAQTSDASIHFTLRNLFGRAEQLKTFSSTAFPNWGTTTGLEFVKPYYADINKRLLISVSNSNYKQPASGYNLHGISPKIELQFPSVYGNHSLMYQLDWRQLANFDNGVPMDIRKHAGHSVKSSVKHVLEVDKRDNPTVPCNGYKTKVVHEVAGLGGDTVYGMTELQTEVYKQIPNSDLVGGASLWCGVLKPFNTTSKLNDRFLLGGPTTLRGFEMWGCGPRTQGYSLGGDAYWAMGLHLYHPLPFVNRTGFFERIRLHAFTTTGNLVKIGNIKNIFNNNRLSCGLGLQARLGAALIEFNYCQPLKTSDTDGLKPGLQLGIGLDML